jgi:hypothetical protein
MMKPIRRMIIADATKFTQLWASVHKFRNANAIITTNSDAFIKLFGDDLSMGSASIAGRPMFVALTWEYLNESRK